MELVVEREAVFTSDPVKADLRGGREETAREIFQIEERGAPEDQGGHQIR